MRRSKLDEVCDRIEQRIAQLTIERAAQQAVLDELRAAARPKVARVRKAKKDEEAK